MYFLDIVHFLSILQEKIQMGEALKKEEIRYFATPEEYLFWEEQATNKHEYHSGEVVAMAGATIAHNIMVVNLLTMINEKLRGKACRPYNSDMKLGITNHNSFVYPDVMVICGKPTLWQDRQDIIENPVLVVEVLSESTANYDRGIKFLKYQSLPSIKEYLLVDSLSLRAELFVRTDIHTWQLEIYHQKEDFISIPSLNIELPLIEIYEGIDF